MKANEDKCHLIVSTNELTEIQMGDLKIKNSASKKFLDVNIDSKLTFDCHVNHLCNKANKKLRALAGVTSYMTLEKKKIVMNSFFNAQFNPYSPTMEFFYKILLSEKVFNKMKIQSGPQKCPYFSLAITFTKIRKPSRFFLHSYWKFIKFFWWKPF